MLTEVHEPPGSRLMCLRDSPPDVRVCASIHVYVCLCVCMWCVCLCVCVCVRANRADQEPAKAKAADGFDTDFDAMLAGLSKATAELDL